MMRTTTKSYARAILITILASILLISAALPDFAGNYPTPSDRIADEASVLSESTIRSIKSANTELINKVGAAVAICTVSTTGETPIDTYAHNVFKNWKLGEGVLLLIAADDKNYYFLPSEGVENVLTLEVLRNIRDNYFESDFAVGNVDRAVQKCVSKLNSTLAADLSQVDKGQNTTSPDKSENKSEEK